MNPACGDIAELLSPWLDGELDDASRDAVEKHLAACPACAAFFAKTQRMDTLYAEMHRVAAPEDFEDRVRDALSAATLVHFPRKVRARSLWPILAAAAFFAVFTVFYMLPAYHQASDTLLIGKAQAPAQVPKKEAVPSTIQSDTDGIETESLKAKSDENATGGAAPESPPLVYNAPAFSLNVTPQKEISPTERRYTVNPEQGAEMRIAPAPLDRLEEKKPEPPKPSVSSRAAGEAQAVPAQAMPPSPEPPLPETQAEDMQLLYARPADTPAASMPAPAPAAEPPALKDINGIGAFGYSGNKDVSSEEGHLLEVEVGGAIRIRELPSPESAPPETNVSEAATEASATPMDSALNAPSPIEAARITGGEYRAEKFGYDSHMGIKAYLVTANVKPMTAKAGGQIETAVSYAVFGAPDTLRFQEKRIMFRHGQKTAELSAEYVRRQNGIWRSVQSIQLSQDTTPGGYTIVSELYLDERLLLSASADFSIE